MLRKQKRQRVRVNVSDGGYAGVCYGLRVLMMKTASLTEYDGKADLATMMETSAEDEE